MTTQQQQGQTGSGQARTQKRKWFSLRHVIRAYGGSLVVTSMAIPIFASAATVCLYLTPPFALPFMSSRWYAPANGLLATVILWLLFAISRSRFATASGANMHVYELLRNRHSDLKARLGLPDMLDNKDAKDHLCAIQKTFNIDDSDSYHIEALRKAYEAYHDLSKNLFYNHSGIEWTLGTGYANTWRMVHRTQEALVEVEPLQEVIGDVIHDIRSIQSSAMSDSKALIRKALQAVKDICPEAMVCFEELQGDKYYADLFGKNAQGQSPLPKEVAIETIRQVKHALNAYQDNLRDALVRGRANVFKAIAITGFVTYLLLCIAILWNGTTSAIGTAAAYYMVGAIAGLFVSFYNEANTKDAPSDDYGLLLSRLIATPLLSGLAGIGGVVITATLINLGGGKTPGLGMIFNGTVTIDYLLAAAAFGYAPKLIIGSLQQRALKFSTDLQNSKGEGTSSSGNS
ncbi:MAG TPA: hypothetical protein VEL31_31050 [Ktedonobacteraceae bacterium]|nr:hypothetical protein [Ktedonobacteraceae bacterium]